MFLIFKPPFGTAYSVINDPDGFSKSFDQIYEEQYAAAILKARQKRKKSARKQIELRKQIKKQIEAGQKSDLVATDIALEQAFKLSQQQLAEELKLEIIETQHSAQLMQKYMEDLRNDIAEMVAAVERQIENKRKRNRANRLKILMLFATMEDDYDS